MVSDVKRKVAILISGRGSNMMALIEAARAEDYPAEIALVVSNVPEVEGLAKARDKHIETVVIDSAEFGKDRAAFEAKLQAALDEKQIDLICLGGFMRLLTAEFVARWEGRILNIHPSLLPSFPGLDPHGQAIRAGVRISGATVHFVTAETDAGPIVMQGAVAVRNSDTPEALAKRVLDVEHRIYPDALRLVAGGAFSIKNGVCRTKADASPEDTLISPALI